MNWQKTILPKTFYERNAAVVAKELLGKFLVRKIEGKVLVGMITETEAYLSEGDTAAHNYKGKTKRNQSLYLDAGHTYVYNLRQYSLLDIVTEGIDIPSSVLIRGIEPIEGIEEMKRRRKTEIVENLASGPGKVCMALGITRAQDGIDVTHPKGELLIAKGDSDILHEVLTSGRIGISSAHDLPLRFFISGNVHVSKKR